jgi:HSP20 family protein
MAIQLWDPVREMVSLRDVVGSLLQESFVRPGALLADGGPAMLPLDVSENDNEFIIKASLPGVRPEDVQITVHGDTVTIRGEMKAEQERKDEQLHLRERRYGVFQRTVRLSSPVRSDQARADFENGVLTLTLPKSEEAKPKQIKIAGRSQDGSGQGQPQVGQGQAQAGQGQPQAAKAAQGAKSS